MIVFIVRALIGKNKSKNAAARRPAPASRQAAQVVPARRAAPAAPMTAQDPLFRAAERRLVLGLIGITALVGGAAAWLVYLLTQPAR